MDVDIPECVIQRLIDNINSIASDPAAAHSSTENGVSIPQRKYGGGAARDAVHNQDLLVFAIEGASYISVMAALRENYTGLIGGKAKVFKEVGQTISLRLEWFGYPPQTFQLRTVDWRTPPQKITLAKLATEVCKIVRQFVQNMERETVAPEYGQWRIGGNGIQLQHLHLGALEQVSAGSWQPRLFYKK